MRVLRPTDYRVMPWKNGLGATTEIAVEPAGASLDAFAWRVSMATIASNGPFSAFPGVDRVIALLDGGPVVLHRPGEPDRALAPFETHAFPGEAAVTATLEGPAARDFNVMARRDRASGSLEVVTIELGARHLLDAHAEARVVFVAEGAITAREGAASASVAAGEALVVGGDRLELTALGGNAIVLVAARAAPAR